MRLLGVSCMDHVHSLSTVCPQRVHSVHSVHSVSTAYGFTSISLTRIVTSFFFGDANIHIRHAKDSTKRLENKLTFDGVIRQAVFMLCPHVSTGVHNVHDLSAVYRFTCITLEHDDIFVIFLDANVPIRHAKRTAKFKIKKLRFDYGSWKNVSC